MEGGPSEGTRDGPSPFTEKSYKGNKVLCMLIEGLVLSTLTFLFDTDLFSVVDPIDKY